MAKKKVKKKRVVKKRAPVKRKVVKRKTPVKKKVVRRVARRPKQTYKRKFDIVLKNMILFTILLIASLVLYNVSTQEMYETLFLLLSMIFAFVDLAFLIVLLVFFVLKIMKK